MLRSQSDLDAEDSILDSERVNLKEGVVPILGCAISTLN